MTLYLSPASYGMNFDVVDKCTKRFIKVSTIFYRLCERRKLDREGADEGELDDLTKMEDDGSFITSLPTLKSISNLRLMLREILSTFRKINFIAACSATAHRTQHVHTQLDWSGPSRGVSCWTLETFIGWSTNRSSGTRNIVREISNNHSREVEMLAIESMYDIHPAAPEISSSRFRQHSQIEGASLVQPRRLSDQLSPDEVPHLQRFLFTNDRRLDNDSSIERWGRAVLSNGDTVRTTWGEGGSELQKSLTEQHGTKQKFSQTCRFVRVSLTESPASTLLTVLTECRDLHLRTKHFTARFSVSSLFSSNSWTDLSKPNDVSLLSYRSSNPTS
jgi:hypothetical protein